MTLKMPDSLIGFFFSKSVMMYMLRVLGCRISYSDES